MKDIDFTDRDIDVLHQAVETGLVSPENGKNGVGRKVTGWLQKAVATVAEGGVNIPTSVASSFFSEATRKFYGL